MATTEYQEMPGLEDERKVLAGGRKYYVKTANKCTTCSSEDSMFYVKMKIGQEQVVLECPVCDTSLTVRREMVDLPKQ